MRLFFLLAFSCLSALPLLAQHRVTLRIQDHDSGESLPGATVLLKGSQQGATANTQGVLTLENIPPGRQVLVFSYVGYATRQLVLQFPLSTDEPLVVGLEPEEELEAVLISATRSSRTIEDIPTRVEAISGEELGEKAVMNSTNIAMLLRESTGIQMQQTSASSANQSIRIQGLDGRYTQLLRDGFPLYSGFAGGLSIMQIPPLDLQQVEVIKGSASTLYGGGAIAGLVNLVTKKPGDEPELSFMLNQTSALGTTLNGFYSSRNQGWGTTLYASGHTQKAYDPNEDGFSDIPQVRSLTLNPRVFRYWGEGTTLWLGLNAALEERTGGNIQALESELAPPGGFVEQNNSKRLSSQLTFDRQLEGGAALALRNSISFFDREIQLPDYRFSGQQWASFSEASYAFGPEENRWIGGLNLFTDGFTEAHPQGMAARDYQHTTLGAFAQHSWYPLEQLALESGLRTDYAADWGTFVLPRLSLMYKPGPKLTARIGGGLGYKLPTPFTEEAEALAFLNVAPINSGTTRAERSLGGNLDLNYTTAIGEGISFSLNQLFFYTRLQNSLMLHLGPGWQFVYANADRPANSRGFETNARLGWGDFKLFMQWAFTDVELRYQDERRQKPLTPNTPLAPY
ncbi:TonB-dependent receptor [Cesiribacter andamanensis]|uniref:Colicin I receptor n=1 Tax=Cesiribacter andamanensis AMV16 TaxID=1279009 RepID=M7N8Q8_9BACT|nr:TonB-dependent receptor [Cesiribacter andamanensis]EMR03647.1 Colicin I receptor precursor [Cesiribacter andamanensis AMV16]